MKVEFAGSLALLAFAVSTASAQVLFTDGFESGLSNWDSVFPDCSGTGTISVDTSIYHSGSSSLKIAGGGGYCNHAFVRTNYTASARPVTYVRMWTYHTTAFPALHVTFLAMTDSTDSKNLRMGAQNNRLAWNRESDDATVPSQSPVGILTSVDIPINTWTCLEYSVDSTNGNLHAYINDAEVAGLKVQSGVADIDAAWLASKPTWVPNIINLKLGWESYASDADTLYYDDVVISSSRIGCSGSAGTTTNAASSTTTRTTTTSVSSTTSSRSSTTTSTTTTTRASSTTTATTTTRASTTTTATTTTRASTTTTATTTTRASTTTTTTTAVPTTTTTRSTTTTTTTTTTASATPTGTCSVLYGQCGGLYFTGATCCTSSTCTYVNDWYSQCL